MHDNCDSCSQDYDFDKERDVLCIYLKNPECNHVLATCPHCGGTTRIFIIPESVIGIMQEVQLPLRMFADTPPDIMQKVAELLGIEMAEEDSEKADVLYHESGTTYGLPEPPRAWLYELYDTMRHFGGECGGCLWHDRNP